MFLWDVVHSTNYMAVSEYGGSQVAPLLAFKRTRCNWSGRDVALLFMYGSMRRDAWETHTRLTNL
jgi:hypothetical protein